MYRTLEKARSEELAPLSAPNPLLRGLHNALKIEAVIVLLILFACYAHCQTADTLALAASVTADAISTQRGIAMGLHEVDPLARPFVSRGAAGQAALSAIQFAGTMLAARLLSRHGHPKAARWLTRLTTASETAVAINNFYREGSTHAARRGQ